MHEKEKFLADAKRLALDMSQNETFSTVQPLMNFWAAFSPSREVSLLATILHDGTDILCYCRVE